MARQLVSSSQPLVAAGRRVIGVDVPGHGDADIGWFGPGRGTLHRVRRTLAVAAERFGRPTAVIAHSMGGAAAAVAVRDGPTSTASFSLRRLPTRSRRSRSSAGWSGRSGRPARHGAPARAARRATDEGLRPALHARRPHHASGPRHPRPGTTRKSPTPTVSASRRRGRIDAAHHEPDSGTGGSCATRGGGRGGAVRARR